jgi:hypothetical protein
MYNQARRKNNVPGTLLAVQHAARMRFMKLRRTKARLARHVQDKIALHNLHASRAVDFIDVDEQKPLKVVVILASLTR